LKYGFARDERVELADGRFADIDMLEQMLCRVQMYDETDHPLGNDADVSGPRAQTYQNESLARGGARSIRSDHHITGGYAVSLAGEPLPPLYIFSSDAKDKNWRVCADWVDPLAYIRGKYGHNRYVKFRPSVAARGRGSIDSQLFMEYIEETTYKLFPKEAVSLEIVFDDYGRVVSGPVLWILDTGNGRIVKNAIKEPEWDKWAKRMHETGILIF